ncbi:Cytochrome c oxidase subunit [Dirofilaria immitis]
MTVYQGWKKYFNFPVQFSIQNIQLLMKHGETKKIQSSIYCETRKSTQSKPCTADMTTVYDLNKINPLDLIYDDDWMAYMCCLICTLEFMLCSVSSNYKSNRTANDQRRIFHLYTSFRLFFSPNS